jgi:hypothetical protein
MIILLAHGALGVFDELIAVTVAVGFFGMMIYAYIRSRALDDADLEGGELATEPSAPSGEDDAPEAPDRYKLD